MFIGLWQSGIIVAAIALVLLGLFVIPRRRRIVETLFGVNDSHENGLELSSGHSNSQSILTQHVAEAASDTDSGLSGTAGGRDLSSDSELPRCPIQRISCCVPLIRGLSETPHPNLLQVKLRWIRKSKQVSGRNLSIIKPDHVCRVNLTSRRNLPILCQKMMKTNSYVYPISHDREEDTEEQEYVPVEISLRRQRFQ